MNCQSLAKMDTELQNVRNRLLQSITDTRAFMISEQLTVFPKV